MKNSQIFLINFCLEPYIRNFLAKIYIIGTGIMFPITDAMIVIIGFNPIPIPIGTAPLK